jgi:TPP-dependent 2-oxoacid decarboxylase
MDEMTVGRYLLRRLEEAGVEEMFGIPYATTIDGKTALPGKHPLVMGVYMGALSRDAVKSQVEGSDGLLSLGAMTTEYKQRRIHCPPARTERCMDKESARPEL